MLVTRTNRADHRVRSSQRLYFNRVSTETIYRCINAQPVVELRNELINSLRQARNKRVPRSKGQDRRGPSLINSVSTYVRQRLRTASFRGTGRVISSMGEGHASDMGTLVVRTLRLLSCKATSSQVRPRPAGLYRQTPWDCRAASPQSDLRSGSRKWPGTDNLQRRSASQSTSATLIAPGYEVPTKTPTVGSDSIPPKALISSAII